MTICKSMIAATLALSVVAALPSPAAADDYMVNTSTTTVSNPPPTPAPPRPTPRPAACACVRG